jgi:hypothetical protein
MNKNIEILVEKDDFDCVLNHCIKVLDIKKEEDFGYMEFGCYIGTSLVYTNKKLFDYNVKYVAFDSFEGLPETPEEEHLNVFTKGRFSCTENEMRNNLKKHNFPFCDLNVYKGFFSDSFKEVDEKNNFKIFMIDCDLYSSTKQALNFLIDYFEKECILLFDDWFALQDSYELGQKKAFDEFVEENPDKFSYVTLGYYKFDGFVNGKYVLVRKNDC